RHVYGKCAAAAENMGATKRLANPGTTLGSNASVGRPQREAANIAGPEAYPPTPITTSGWNSTSMRHESQTARGRSNTVLNHVASDTFLRQPTRMRHRGNPAAGTRRFSIPRAVPMNK